MGIFFDRITDPNNLYQSFQQCKKGTIWKESVQRYGSDLLNNISILRNSLINGSYKQKPFVEFDLCERGKKRHVKSMHISDRILQRTICDYVLTPTIIPTLIYDNGASVKDKGITFARNRLQCHLEKYIRKHGINGYILKGDFSKFFDNIDHELTIQMLKKYFGQDTEFMNLMVQLINSFQIDVSNLSEEKIKFYENNPIDLLKIKPCNIGEKFLKRSVGIGSQISQIIGIFYPSSIDHLIKIKHGCKFYGRYMDDFYIIHEDKEFLENILNEIREESKRLKLFINEKKTKIIPFKHGLTYMKIRYRFTPNGKIIKTISPDSITRERRRLKKYAKNTNIPLSTKDIFNAYQSWRGNVRKFNANRSIINMDRLFAKLFKDKGNIEWTTNDKKSHKELSI